MKNYSLLVLLLLFTSAAFSQIKPKKQLRTSQVLNAQPDVVLMSAENFIFNPDFHNCYIQVGSNLFPFKVTDYKKNYSSEFIQKEWKVDANGPTWYTENSDTKPLFSIEISGEFQQNNAKKLERFYLKYTDIDYFNMITDLLENYDSEGKLVLSQVNAAPKQIEYNSTARSDRRTYASKNPSISYIHK